jgi:large subunit ribosomal protein L9
LEKVGRIGNVGDKVTVKSCYARNFLFPIAKAVPATKPNIADFESRKAEMMKVAAEKQAAAQARADKLAGVTITVEANAGDEGKLFGSIGTRDIADALEAAGHTVEKSEVLLPEGALRETGEYTVTLSLGSDVTTDITLLVSGLNAPSAPVAEEAGE